MRRWYVQLVCNLAFGGFGVLTPAFTSSSGNAVAAPGSCGSSGAAIPGGGPAAPVQVTELRSPLSRQVVQVDASGSASVSVAGLVDQAVICLEVKADLEAGQRGQSLPWQRLDANVTGLNFSGSVRLALGGWYTVSVRAWTTAGPGTVVSVAKVGVGEVFVAAGQSNSTNFGFVRQVPQDDHVSAWNGTTWQWAADPQPLATTDGSSGGSPWPPMADQLIASWRVPVAILSVGWGGTSVEQWQPGGVLYPRLASVLGFLGKHGARAVLWHQGEADTLDGTTAPLYAERLRRIIDQSRVDAGYDVEWFVAGASYIGVDHEAQQPAIRLGQAEVIDHQSIFPGPTTDDLLGANRGPDGIHFSGPGLNVHGARWATVLEQAIQVP